MLPRMTVSQKQTLRSTGTDLDICRLLQPEKIVATILSKYEHRKWKISGQRERDGNGHKKERSPTLPLMVWKLWERKEKPPKRALKEVISLKKS